MPDKFTIVLGSDVPRPGVFDFLQYFTMVDKNLMESPDAATNANGTGPFTFVEWISGDHVTMQRNAITGTRPSRISTAFRPGSFALLSL